MEWTDKGLVLGVKTHGETSVIAEMMTAEHGRHLGLIRGGRSRRLRPVLQPGNLLQVSWRARLEDHLGQFQVDALQLRAASILENRTALNAVNTLTNHLRLLPEREAHHHLYEASNIILENLDDMAAIANLLVRFELALLEDLGFGLDLTRCAATKATTQLRWVSPRSACAVSKSAGEPYADKLLPLPEFLRPSAKMDSADNFLDLYDAFQLTSYFLNKNIYSARGIKPCEDRVRIIANLKDRADQ